MASLPAKSLCARWKYEGLGRVQVVRGQNMAARKCFTSHSPAEGQLSTSVPLSGLRKSLLNIWDWEEVSPSSLALVIPLMGSKLWGSSLVTTREMLQSSQTKLVKPGTKGDWLCLWTEQVLSLMGYSLDDWEVILLDYVHFANTLEIHFLLLKRMGWACVSQQPFQCFFVCPAVLQLDTYQLAFPAFLAVDLDVVWVSSVGCSSKRLKFRTSVKGVEQWWCRKHQVLPWELSRRGFAQGRSAHFAMVFGSQALPRPQTFSNFVSIQFIFLCETSFFPNMATVIFLKLDIWPSIQQLYLKILRSLAH